MANVRVAVQVPNIKIYEKFFLNENSHDCLHLIPIEIVLTEIEQHNNCEIDVGNSKW